MLQTKIIFLILPHTHLLDLAGADQVFYEAKDQGAAVLVEYCALGVATATSSRLAFAKLKPFNKVTVRKGDYIFVPGADMGYLNGAKITREKELALWLKHSYEKGAIICSICTGAFLLARTGMLNGKKCTTHWKRTAELQQKYPLTHVVENILFTEDNGIYTSAGVVAGIDMALHILSKLKDDHFSFKVARELVVYMRRQGMDAQQSVFMQFRNHIHTGIHEVQDYVQEHINKGVSLTRLADIACMSPRNLTRIFKKETGINVGDYITLIRKELLENLAKNPDITRKQMARLCGFKSERQVIRLLQTDLHIRAVSNL